jgi:hypothetical protein
METYRENSKVVRLKTLGEFDNKIFIMVSDHGHTAMPTDLTHKDKKTGKVYEADDSCTLKLKNFDEPENQFPELANNNLHIWELANLFTLFPKTNAGKYLKVLAPEELLQDKNLSGATDETDKATIITALNGPMAHIYVRGNTWTNNPDVDTLRTVASILNRVLKAGSLATDDLATIINDNFPNLSSSVEAILVREEKNNQYVVVKDVIKDNQNILQIVPETVEKYFENKTDYANAVNRINALNDFNRSGDIILIFNNKTDSLQQQRYTSGVACKSWHGSLNRSDSYIPFIISYPGGNSVELGELENKVCTRTACNGNWMLQELVKEFITGQYSKN